VQTIHRAPLLLAGAISVALLALGVVAARPVEIDVDEIRRRLEREIGGAALIESAEWHWVPSPRLALSELRYTRELLGRWPIRLGARRVEVAGRLPLGAASTGPERTRSYTAALGRPQEYDRISIQGIHLELGRLRLERGEWTLAREGAGHRIRGRALGGTGGRVDARGEIDATGATGVRLYLSALDLGPFARPTGGPGGSLRLGGTIALAREGGEGDRLDVDLRAEGLRAAGGERWLDASLRGALTRQGGMLLEGSRLEAIGTLRDVYGRHDLDAVHGPLRATLALIGPTDDLRLEFAANLRDLRVRLAPAFEKPAGAPAFLRLEGRWSNGALDRARGWLELGPIRARLERSATNGWAFRTSWVPIEILRARVPALDRLPRGLTGRARVRGSWDPERGLRGEAEVRDAVLRVEGREIRLDAGRVYFAPASIRVEAPDLQLEEQRLDLWVDYSGAEREAPIRLRVGGRADALDLERVAYVLDPILGTPLVDPTLEDILRQVVSDLNARPRLLRRLEIAPSVLRVDRLRGLGLHADAATIRLEFRDQTLHLACVDGEGGMPDRSVSVEFTSWAPRVTNGS
jgi:hypothetical protein